MLNSTLLVSLGKVIGDANSISGISFLEFFSLTVSCGVSYLGAGDDVLKEVDEGFHDGFAIAGGVRTNDRANAACSVASARHTPTVNTGRYQGI